MHAAMWFALQGSRGLLSKLRKRSNRFEPLHGLLPGRCRSVRLRRQTGLPPVLELSEAAVLRRQALHLVLVLALVPRPRGRPAAEPAQPFAPVRMRPSPEA